MTELREAVDIQLGRLGDVKLVTFRYAYGERRGQLLHQVKLTEGEDYAQGVERGLAEINAKNTQREGL